MKSNFLLIIIALWVYLAATADVGGKIVVDAKGKQKPPHVEFDKITATLEGEHDIYKTYLYQTGIFKFTNIPEGNYVLKIDDLNNFYDTVAIEVTKGKEKNIVRAYEYGKWNSKINKSLTCL